MFKWLKKLLFRKKEEVFLTQIPHNVVPYINKKLKEINAHLTAQVAKLEIELKEIKQDKEKNAKKEEEELIKEVIKKKEQQRFIEKQKELKVLFSYQPSFALNSNRTLGKLAGVMLKETDEGVLLWYPLIKWGKGFMKFPHYSLNFQDFFKEQTNIVSQLKSGKVNTNFDFTDSKKPILIKPKWINPETGKMLEVKDISDIERREYELRIAGLKEDIQEIYNNLSEAKEREADTNSKIALKELNLRASLKERDIYASIIGVLAEKQPQVIKDMANSVAAIQDTTMRQILGEYMEEAYGEKYKKALKELRRTHLPEIATPENREMMNLVREELASMKQELKPREAIKEKEKVKK